MGQYTRVGNVTSWPPYRKLSGDARSVFWALYTGQYAKEHAPPGLFVGGDVLIAEEAGMGVIDVGNALTEMEERHFIERDRPARMLRLVELPDRGLRAANGRWVKSWWLRWKALPDCELKYAHVPLLEWLLHPLSADHRRTWDETFGSRQVFNGIPSVRLVVDVQPGLFDTLDQSTDTCLSNQLGYGYTPRGSEKSVPERVDAPPTGTAFTVTDLTSTLERCAGDRVCLGPPLDTRICDTLRELVGQCERERVTLADIELAGHWLAAGGLSYRSDLGLRWLAGPGNLFDVVGLARKWDKGGRQSLAPAATPRRGAGLSSGDLLGMAAEAAGAPL